jgi:threonine dehydratase
MVSYDDVQAAHERIAPWLRPTPLVQSDWLSRRTGSDVWLKLETLQPTHAFKIRGALNVIMKLTASGRASPQLVVPSAGNHGLAMAEAAARVAATLTVFTPRHAPEAKLSGIRRLGATLRAECADYDDAERRAREWALAHNAVFVSGYNNPDVIAGAGTIGLEILDDLPDADAIVVPLGGGGLLSGIATAVRGGGWKGHVVGVETAANPAMSTALASGRIVRIEPGPTLADGLSGNLEEDSVTFELLRRLAPDIVSVEEDDIRRSLGALLAEERLVAEGAGVVGVAALVAGRIGHSITGPVVIVLSGANIDLAIIADALDAHRRSS